MTSKLKSELIDTKPKSAMIADIFRDLIASGRLQQGEKLLSDEAIAQKYRINKRTVACGLNTLAKEGLLKRAPRRGTIVVKEVNVKAEAAIEEETAPEILSSPHKMEYLFFIKETKELNFMLFESIPEQRAMWQELCGRFNKKSKARQILPEFMDLADFGPDWRSFRSNASLRGKTPDIIQSILANTHHEHLMELPEDLRNFSHGEDSLGKGIIPDFRGYQDKIVPVYTIAPTCIWNQEMEHASKISGLKDQIIAGNMIGALCAAAEALPDTLDKIGPHLSAMFRHFGQPLNPDDVNRNYFYDFFKNIFAGLSQMDARLRSKMFICDCDYQSYSKFIHRRYFLLQTLSTPPHFPDTDYIEFDLGVSLIAPTMRLNSEISALGISAECKEHEYAEDFLRFIISPESQQYINSKINAIPFRLSTLKSLPEHTKNISNAEIGIITEKLSFASYEWQQRFTLDFCHKCLTPLWKMIENAEINSAEDAAEYAYMELMKYRKDNKLSK